MATAAGVLVLAGAWTIGLAEDGYGVDAVDTAVRVFAAWLAPAGLLGVLVTRRALQLGAPRWILVLAGVSLLGALGGTGVVTQNSAPRGTAHSEDLNTGKSRLRQDVDAALDAAGHGPVRYVDLDLEPCRDSFGRDRGAATSGFHIEPPTVVSSDISALRQAFAAMGWEVRAEAVSTLGGDALEFVATSDGFSVRVGPIREDVTPGQFFSAATPCLRVE